MTPDEKDDLGPITVTVTDPDTGEVLAKQERLTDDYVIVCAGRCFVHHVNRYANGTTVITVKKDGA